LAETPLVLQNLAIFIQIVAFEIVFATGLLPIFSAVMLGLQKFRDAAAIGIASTLIRQSPMISLVVSIYNFVGLVLAWAISDLTAAMVYATYLLPTFGNARFHFSVRELLHFSWPLGLSNDLSYASQWFDHALLLIFVPLSSLGIYDKAATVFSVLTGVNT